MNGEGRRSREAVRNSIRTYGVKVMDPASLPLKRTKERESQESVSRFSEKSLHSHYEMQEAVDCRLCGNKTPWPTLAAFILCLVGLLMFVLASLRSAALTNRMIAEVLVEDGSRVETFDIVFIVLEASTGVFALLILIMGVLSTGETRRYVFCSPGARELGKMCIAALMFFTVILLLGWLLVFWLFSILFYVGLVSQSVCESSGALNEKTCLHLSDLRIFANFDSGDIEICGKTKIKAFCRDFAYETSPSYIIAAIGNFLIILSLVMFLICLAANYARIRCQAKFQEVEEIRYMGQQNARYAQPEIRIMAPANIQNIQYRS